MKRRTIIFAMAIGIATLLSCAKSKQTENYNFNSAPAILHLSIGSNNNLSTKSNTKNPNSGSKAIGEGHGVQSNDNIVQSLDIFIFRNEENADKEKLESYENLSGAKLGSLNNISIKATTGKKIIYVVANSHISNLSTIKNLSDFKQLESSLLLENSSNFTMLGNTEVNLEPQTSITINVERLAARVQLSSISENFDGTAYQGQSLKNIKIYLINAHAKKILYNGASLNSPFIINNKKAVASDYSSAAMSGIVYDNGPSSISNALYSNPHYFYTYENTLSTENATNRFTRLVIQADLDGTTYYYPININQEGYGYTASNGHKGIKRNTTYNIACTIKGIGSLNPDEPIQKSTATISISVSNWLTVPTLNYEF